MWFQHILMSNSWSSHCPSCDQPLLPRWKVWTWRFWKEFGRGGWGLVARWDFFCMLWLVVMVVWWVRRNWWDGSTQSQTAGLTLLPHHASPRLNHSFYHNVENILWTLQNHFTTRCFPKEQSVHGHVPALEISFGRKIGKHVLSHFKTRTFRDQISGDRCFDITFCTGSGRRTHVLQIAKNLYGAVASPVVFTC
jgi:hypothetical protein